MNRVFGFTLAAGIVLVAASACVENKGTLFVQAVMAPPVAMAGAACTYDPQPTSPIMRDLPCACANRCAAENICAGVRHL